jgi:hypothetical protein
VKFLNQKSKLFCFTPEVMLFTFLTEFALALYVFVRYRTTTFGKLAVVLLLLLGSFQFVEYQICAGLNSVMWSRIGFVIITILPALGLQLVSLVTGKTHFVKFGYTLMAVYIAIFAFAPKAITDAICGGNYIIFHTQQELSWTYSAYYFGLLLVGIWEAREGMKANPLQKKLLLWMIAGYGSFMIPMGFVYMIAPIAARNATPSIMCGFAVLFALILAFKIVPDYYRATNKEQ